MNKKALFFIFSFLGILIFFIIEIVYLNNNYSLNNKILDKKIAFVKITKLPDLAIYNETFFIRHRTLATVFDIYNEDGTLREYAKGTYVIGDYKHE